MLKGTFIDSVNQMSVMLLYMRYVSVVFHDVNWEQLPYFAYVSIYMSYLLFDLPKTVSLFT